MEELLIASNIVLHVPRVAHVLLTISRRGAHLEPSGAAGWGGVVLHGTPEVQERHSVRMSRRIAWARQAMRERIITDKAHRRVTNEGRDPKTLPRPSQCGANSARNFPRIRKHSIRHTPPHTADSQAQHTTRGFASAAYDTRISKHSILHTTCRCDTKGMFW